MAEEEKRISPAVVVGGLGLALVAAVGVAALAMAAPPPGRANLYGKVTNSVTGEAIADVLVMLNGLQVFTDAQGNYAFADIEPGEYVLQFSKDGYETAVF